MMEGAMRQQRYTILLTPEEDGGFTVTSPFFPGLVTYAENREDAITMAKDAAEGLLLVKLEYGDEIPYEVQPPELAQIDVDLDELHQRLKAERTSVPA
jgi:antitoxin HicB